jgi:hypothetical protein
MSSTSKVQAYLTSVFRPVYTYTTATSNFTTELDISNVNTVTANLVECLRADVGAAEPNSNVFVGVLSGVNFLNLQSCFSNTAVGYGAGGQMSNVSNVVAIGFNSAAGVTSTSNSMFIGKNVGPGSIGLSSCLWLDPTGGAGAGNTSSNTIALGASTGIVGSSNIWIGTNAGNANTGVGNITIGHSIPVTAPTNYLLQVGVGSNVVIAGDMSQNAIAIGKADATMQYIDGAGRVPGLVLDVSGYARIANGLAIGMDPLQSTLDVNGTFRANDGYGLLSLDHDSAGNSRAVTSGFMQMMGGSHSREGSSGVSGTAIGILCRGITMVASSTDAKIFWWNGSNSSVASIISTGGGSAISAGNGTTSPTSNILYTGASNAPYNISYFPLPAVGLYPAGTGV